MDHYIRLSLILLSFFLISCGGVEVNRFEQPSLNGIIPNPNPDPALEAAAANILGPKCANCHGVTGNNPRFLNTPNSPGLNDLAQNTNYVRIGQAEGSRLFQRSSDGSMPPGNPLTAAEYNAIGAWIDDLGIDAGGGPQATTFTEVETQILTPKCYNCHTSGAGASAGFVFSNYNDLLFGFVTSGNLDSSLYLSVTRSTDPMPRGGPRLNQTEIDMIGSWILNGALND